MMHRKILHYLHEGRIEKSVPQDHRLSSLGKPHDAKRRSSGRTFLSYPHTHDRFLYYSLVDNFLFQIFSNGGDGNMGYQIYNIKPSDTNMNMLTYAKVSHFNLKTIYCQQ